MQLSSRMIRDWRYFVLVGEYLRKYIACPSSGLSCILSSVTVDVLRSWSYYSGSLTLVAVSFLIFDLSLALFDFECIFIYFRCATSSVIDAWTLALLFSTSVAHPLLSLTLRVWSHSSSLMFRLRLFFSIYHMLYSPGSRVCS